MGELRVGERDPGQEILPHLAAEAEQDRADDQPRLIRGPVGELRPACGVADGINAPVGRAEPPTHLDAALAISNAGFR
jgi:hypothetical protein